jgi:hypothetical protein
VHARSRRAWLAICVAFAPALEARAEPADPWAIPAEGSCETSGALILSATDAVPPPFRVGDVLDERKTVALENFVPPELWAHRERFFYEGMQLEIGPCYRNYAPPEFFAAATAKFRGQARLAPEGGLENYEAGLPFAPDSIDPDDPRAARRWAWNWASRYQAGGSFGDYRISLLSRDLQQRFTGSYFFVPLAGRADRPNDGYRFPSPLASRWVAGGESTNVDTGGECKFRQYAVGTRQPDYFVWHSGSRKVSRETAHDAEFALTGCLLGASIGDGLFLHGESPQLHEWKLVGVRDVLAPINAKAPVYPVDKQRGFGPAGVSFANDRGSCAARSCSRAVSRRARSATACAATSGISTCRRSCRSTTPRTAKRGSPEAWATSSGAGARTGPTTRAGPTIRSARCA